MDDVTRRDALKLASAAGAGAVVGAAPGAAAAQEEKKKRQPTQRKGQGKKKIPDELGKMVKQLAGEMQAKLSAAAKEGRFRLDDQQIRTIDLGMEARISSPQLPGGVVIIIISGGGGGTDFCTGDRDPSDPLNCDSD